MTILPDIGSRLFQAAGQLGYLTGGTAH